MARLNVYWLKSSDILVADLQARLFDALSTRVVAPLLPLEDVAQVITRLNPRIELHGEVYSLSMHLIGAISVKDIGEKVGDLSDYYDEVLVATDFLFQGF